MLLTNVKAPGPLVVVLDQHDHSIHNFHDIFINLKHPIRFESQTHLQDDHTDRITDCSTRCGQAPVVGLHSRETGQGKMAKGRPIRFLT